MLLFRTATEHDLDDIYCLALAGGAGLTTLPKDKYQLQQRIGHSLASFSRIVEQASDENYLFVLEDVNTGRVVGTSAIEAAVGYDLPFYSYKLSQVTRICHDLDTRYEYGLLNLVNDYQGKTEICTLFLDESYRRNYNGLLLSKARFLFIAEFPERFSDLVIAEMRGVSDLQGESPFWNSLGQHFFPLSFSEADRLTVLTNKQFISDLMPRNPIYTNLLSQAAQDVIAKPHESTKPAMRILEKEGFSYQGYVDIFDGGPTIEAPIAQIKTILDSGDRVITNIIDEVNARSYFISNAKTDFRASIGQVMETDEGCIIDTMLAELLKVDIGDRVKVVAI